VLAAVMSIGCRSPSNGPPQPVVVGWQKIASWNGHGNAQLGTFPIERWDWRIQWETTNEAPAGAGDFRVEAHSADSGRTLAEPIDYQGVGRDTAYVSVQPHRFYLVVESKNLDWSITVEEPILR
jgi:hypothetical protein